MPEFFGVCGRFTQTPCKLVWASTYPTKIGTYPSDILPSSRTIWHASSDAGFNFSAPLISPGDSFGSPIGGILFGVFAPPQFDTFTPRSQISVIFAQTANRLNVTHIITQSEINQAQQNNGIAEIDVGEYIFDAIGVTDQIETLTTELTVQELEDIQKTGEAESDRAFRKLFEGQIPETRNRLLGVKVNLTGIEYRFDNGGPKSTSAFFQSSSEYSNASYRDGSSRVLRIDLNKIIEDRIPLPPGVPSPPANSLQAQARLPRAGDTIYLSYVAVRDHYLRQTVEAPYTIVAISIPPQAFGLANTPKVANYRFFEWFINPSTPNGTPVKIGGWRIVESFNIQTNFIAPVGTPGAAELGHFIIGGGGGLSEVSYLNTAGGITEAEILEFVSNRATASRAGTYTINLNQTMSGGSYRQQLDQSFKLTPWYQRQVYTTYRDYSKAIEHIFYNVHSKALQKRDVDKFGIERFLAEQIEQDFKQGASTFVPFLDGQEFVDPSQPISVYLDSSNTKFDPVLPVSRYSLGNVEIEAGVAGAIQLGNTGSRDDVVAVFGFNSNPISERFEKDTRVWVEKHFVSSFRGARTIAIEGAVGARSSLSCIGDPSREYSFLVHVTPDNFMCVNDFSNPFIHEGISKLKYRPDIEQSNEDISGPDQYPPLLGFNGLLGDRPGFKPGRIISSSFLSDPNNFKYLTTSRTDFVRKNPHIPSEQITEITFQKNDTKLSISMGLGYFGRTELNYEYTGTDDIEIMMVFKSGGSVESVIESIFLSPTYGMEKVSRIKHQWLKGDTAEIVGDLREIDIKYLNICQMADSRAIDFLDSETSTTSDEKEQSTLAKYSRSVFFETDIITIGEDNKSRLFVFFNDKDNGISCVQSNDFGQNWYFHYGIVEPINGEASRHPFIVHSFELNGGFLFYLFSGKILCRFIDYSLFSYTDSMIIERYETDRVVTTNDVTTEKSGLYSNSGKSLRRDLVSYAAAGDLTADAFLEISGHSIQTNEYTPLEVREVETIDGGGQTKLENTTVRKNPIAIGSGTAFLNKDITDLNFSAYRTDHGVLKLFFLAETSGPAAGNQLQCNFSLDNGVTWFDYWEWIDNQYNRLRVDSTRKTQWIDRTASGERPSTIQASDPKLGNQVANIGVNIHWSRLKRHKIEGGATVDSESQVLTVEAPYLFLQPTTKQTFLFYFYEGCLLCKIFSDDIFTDAAKRGRDPGDPNVGMARVKDIIEHRTRAHFVDGDLSSAEMREEIHNYYNESSNEIMKEGNIIFRYQHAIERFNADRRLSPQRVCAYELSQGLVRAFYKNSTGTMRACLWTGNQWIVEDLLRDDDSEIDISPRIDLNATYICGGFNGNNFEECSA